ncbi:MAG: hypothetical protein ABIH72_01900 [archaeon]
METFDYFPAVELSILAEASRDISTREHLRNLERAIKDSYQNNGSILKALKDGAIFELLITASRATYLYSKIQNKLPDKLIPDSVRYSTVGIAADLLANSS